MRDSHGTHVALLDVNAEDFALDSAFELGVERVRVVEQDGLLHKLGPVVGAERKVEVLLARFERHGHHVSHDVDLEDVGAINAVLHLRLEDLHARNAQLERERDRAVPGDACGCNLRFVQLLHHRGANHDLQTRATETRQLGRQRGGGRNVDKVGVQQ